MAVEAGRGYSELHEGSASVFDDTERAGAFTRAERHTRIVRTLRIALPACAVLILAFYFFSSSLSVSIGGIDASVKRIEVNSDRLRMVNPKMEGMSKDKTPYTVTAEYAEQELKNPSQVHLTRVRADMDSAKQGWTRMTAPTGLFDTTKETLVLTGDIRIATSSGMRSHLTRADINMKTQRVISNEPVAMNALNGTINASTMEILMKEKRVIFRQNVKVHIYKRPAKTTKSGSPKQ